jgi:hypothetical protein
MNLTDMKSLDQWFSENRNNSKYYSLLNNISICKNNKNYYEVISWIKENSVNSKFFELLEYIKEKELCYEYFNLLLYIKDKFPNINNNKVLDYILLDKKVNSISNIRNFKQNKLIFNQKPKIFGLSQNASICVSLVNSPNCSKIIMDDDISTFTLKIPELEGSYDLKYFCGNAYFCTQLNTKERINNIKESIRNIHHKTFFNEINLFIVDLEDKYSYYYIEEILSKEILNSYDVVILTNLNPKSDIADKISDLKNKTDFLVHFDLKSFIMDTYNLSDKDDYDINIINLRIISKFIEDICKSNNNINKLTNENKYLKITNLDHLLQV